MIPRVHNSLTDQLDVLHPLQSGTRTLHWYTCGPTVYDACHMGHARAYLTFDILRRILTDYFHYHVTYQINMTDIDDKIILRARQNHLVAAYTAQQQQNDDDSSTVQHDVQAAVAAMQAKLERKVEAAEQELAEAKSNNKNNESSVDNKLQETLQECIFKREQFQATQQAIASATTTEQLIAAAHDALAVWLDDQFGQTVSDPSIFERHARKYENEFYQDMRSLGVRDPDVVTRVTEYVPEVVAYIATIIENGFAYAAPSGSVYFHTQAFTEAGYEYRKLKPAAPSATTSAADMAEGEGALGDQHTAEKKHPNDFALWKAGRPGEPTWESPWGLGRPGWHIECSVMASDIFGNNLDIHGGGVDLMFPHHDNEMAQAEAFHQCNQWVNYFLHAGHLHIKGLKMSKSLKNFITIRQALEEHTPRQIRLMFLLQPWDKPMNYSDQTVNDAKTKEQYFKNFFGQAKAVLRTPLMEPGRRQGWTPADRALHQTITQTQESVHASLLDNFKTYQVIQSLVDLVSECNKYLAAATDKEPPKHFVIQTAALYVTKMLRLFGVVNGTDAIGFGDTSSSGSSGEDAVAPFVDALVQFRDGVRDATKQKSNTPQESSAALLAQCDHVRDVVLAQLGVRVEDSTDSSVWKMDDPAVIAKEIADKKRQQAEAAAKKHAAKITRLEQELVKATQAAIVPSKYFETVYPGKYKMDDAADAAPTTDAATGEPLSKSQRKSVAKELANHTKAHNKLVAAAKDGDIAAHLEGLAATIDQLKQQKET